MKFFWIGLSILAIILTCCLTVLLPLRHNCLETAELLSQAIEASEQEESETAAQLAEAAERDWQKYDKLLASFLCHDETDTVNDHFSRLRSYTATGNRSEFHATCSALVTTLEDLACIDHPCYFNIF